MESSMHIKFWGVRGSVPSPGPTTIRYGGNTSCVSIDQGGGKILVLDAGTGIREMGKALEGRQADFFILLSHNHWDHIQGFPFFIPLYQSNRKIFIFPTLHGEEILCSLVEQMDGANSPINTEDLPSHYECVPRNPLNFLGNHGFTVSQIATNHPGGGHGYRIDSGNRSVVYITDNELEPPYQKTTDFEEFVRFCKDVDVLIHDSQYLEQDMPRKHGWGHSLVSQVQTLAAQAEVKHLILFHHDPDRTDKEIDTIQDSARSWFHKNKSNILCTAAFEGLELTVS
jgi:phosphoribosyl 1,2-cyclic phosphodiesterase